MVALVPVLVAKCLSMWKLELGPFEKNIDGKLLWASTTQKPEPSDIIGYLS
jgi:hypothetical protein